MKPTILLYLLLALCATAAAPRPNIILIMSDDMGFSDIGCYGGEIDTPELDGLADGGLRFTQFYNTARCCPTRASLLTGLYPHQAGIGHMMDDRGLDGYRGDLNRNCVTIAEALRTAGYATYMAGKWHVTEDGRRRPEVQLAAAARLRPLLRHDPRRGQLYDPNTLTRDNTQLAPDTDPEYSPERPFYYTDAISDQRSRFIGEHEHAHPDKPFFMYVAYTAAHWPMHALEKTSPSTRASTTRATRRSARPASPR